MFFLRLQRKHGLSQELLRQFYTAVMESVLCTSIIVWFGDATITDKLHLYQTIKTSERIVETTLPTLENFHATRTMSRASKSLSDPPHPGDQLFQLLPSEIQGYSRVPVQLSTRAFHQTMRMDLSDWRSLAPPPLATVAMPHTLPKWRLNIKVYVERLLEELRTLYVDVDLTTSSADPQAPPPLSSQYTKTSKDLAIQDHFSRFSNQSKVMH
ncbi:uncharacterized protein LOC133502739 [Syngnathoides biaculeatus]|uniref:uncharacterized protein LOC133502739 n=1 Tax=Syngnathoides biaculeatus TaxID=300417 RepID=UPI002ADD5764|nr:uncharacterized protein LOC133502739 [Syngnathoides biaculeatus]